MVLSISSKSFQDVKEVNLSLTSPTSPLQSNISDNKKYYLVSVTDRLKEKVLAIFENTMDAVQLKNVLDRYVKENIRVLNKDISSHLLMVQNEKKYYMDQNIKLHVHSKLDLNTIFDILKFQEVSHYFMYNCES
ncbi:MAG: hypothetical protein Q8K60_02380 [Parachlamydiaceae bacterium]|nr:hypothetical protein [Parachlamydiaceae bacterium]